MNLNPLKKAEVACNSTSLKETSICREIPAPNSTSQKGVWSEFSRDSLPAVDVSREQIRMRLCGTGAKVAPQAHNSDPCFTVPPLTLQSESPAESIFDRLISWIADALKAIDHFLFRGGQRWNTPLKRSRRRAGLKESLKYSGGDEAAALSCESKAMDGAINSNVNVADGPAQDGPKLAGR